MGVLGDVEFAGGIAAASIAAVVGFWDEEDGADGCGEVFGWLG